MPRQNLGADREILAAYWAVPNVVIARSIREGAADSFV
jgi:hypothetical protein